MIPAHNEAGNLPWLIETIVTSSKGHRDNEIVVVDDARDDQSATVLAQPQQRLPPPRVLRHVRNSGQSTVLINGMRHARETWIGTLDRDAQNDPADLPRLLAEIEHRVDATRGSLLRNATSGSGYSIRRIGRAALLRVPAFDHMHRFLPALIRQGGWTVDSMTVNHRPRRAGRSHYGTWNCLWVGIVDLFGVARLGRRARLTTPNEQRVERAAVNEQLVS